MLSLLFIVAQVWLDLKIPDYMAEITRLTQTPGSKMTDILSAGGSMLVCAIGSLLSAVVVGFLAARIAAEFSMCMRRLLFIRVTSFSMAEINRFSTDSLITRSTNDISQIQIFIIMALQIIIKAPIMATWAINKIAGKGTEWTIATGVTVIIMLIMIALIMIFVMPKFKKMQTLTDNINRVTRENLSGLPVVRAYNAESYQEEKFEAANEELTNTQLFTGRAMSAMMPLMSLLLNGLTLSVYWIGAYLIKSAVIKQKLTLFSNMIVFSSYAMQVVMSFMMFAMIFILWPRASISAKRIHEVLQTKSSIVDGEAGKGIAKKADDSTNHNQYKKGEIVFNCVSFRYPDAADYVLRDISFKVNHGETVAFIGATGSGKSTLVNLIPRMYDATSGEILIDGVNVKDYCGHTLHNKIGYVPQQAALFKGSIRSNVAYGERSGGEFSEEEMLKAVEIAQGKDFVESMDDGYDSSVSQGGSNLSGGQKQRIAIARAICRNPEIYIFDDSFSALDYKTDRLLRQKLKEATGDVTKLIVAQRIGTVIDADCIFVLDEGRIVGRGTHNELLKTCDLYKEIAESQLSEEEVAV